MIREVTCQTVQVGNLANMEQTCKEQPEPNLGMNVQARYSEGAKVKAEKNNTRSPKLPRKRRHFFFTNLNNLKIKMKSSSSNILLHEQHISKILCILICFTRDGFMFKCGKEEDLDGDISLLRGFNFNKFGVKFTAMIRGTNGGHEGNIKQSTAVMFPS